MQKSVLRELKEFVVPGQAAILQRFFKTGPGEYGEGDCFLGVSVPHSRIVARRHLQASFKDIDDLFLSSFHEVRLVGALILVEQYVQELVARDEIASYYVVNAPRFNNWDFVDLSAPKILGDYLLSRDRAVLYRLAASNILWERRIAIISTLAFVREQDYTDALKLAELLLADPHDLIHKAVGWVLREIGKRDANVLRCFLNKHLSVMPRVTLRYSIERFHEAERQHYLKLRTKEKQPITNHDQQQPRRPKKKTP